MLSQGNRTKQCITLSGKSYQTMNNTVMEIKPNDTQYYQRNQIKLCIMLSRKSYQTTHNVIKAIKPSDA